ncbi:hypothetical protein [Meiothermus taiwanensis]|jgi:uncharacterized membrane protein YgaE (UPF0421/DUF939 family)|uniref:Uncharacterized protein n=2 Tax=Meiothermus taiwanensis TaxID=172827 RepID=A0A399E5P8_9DEIN|nr:hypothetical protein [Meiothermus taiwanensis]AWR85439.1 hypothetical protein Mtai_v1c01880 [Meiothermus taiwanensis WR-220]KIQ54408.1 hypothetical protein SY28_08805 [Meiothermus taiwanensis]KZK15591.1 hypothetical protein A3962_09660 [Meiothermus taiwanensis]RIH80044.1 hypothetical protein Mcate_00015 [Meiothermus taiwanensis]
MLYKILQTLGVLLWTGFLVYFTAYLFSLGYRVQNLAQGALIALMLLAWVALWMGHGRWLLLLVGLQLGLVVLLYLLSQRP